MRKSAYDLIIRVLKSLWDADTKKYVVEAFILELLKDEGFLPEKFRNACGVNKEAE